MTSVEALGVATYTPTLTVYCYVISAYAYKTPPQGS